MTRVRDCRNTTESGVELLIAFLAAKVARGNKRLIQRPRRLVRSIHISTGRGIVDAGMECLGCMGQ